MILPLGNPEAIDQLLEIVTRYSYPGWEYQLESNMGVSIRIWTEPNKNLIGHRIDVPHDTDLVAAFCKIFLVDSNPIRPKYA